MRILRLLPEDMKEIIKIVDKFNLDFDDAYHYVIAEKYNLTIISFDSDFDITKKGRITPKEILEH